MENNNDWTDLHLDFDFTEQRQQQWQQIGCTRSETKEWLDLGFAPCDYNIVQHWKSHNFTPSEVKKWATIGLNTRDCHFTTWLKNQSYNPNTIINLPKLRTEFNNLNQTNPQQWLEFNYLNYCYPSDTSIEELDISYQNLTGSLNLSAYQQLEELNCYNNQLTNLNLSGCQRLREIYFSNNKLTNLNLSNNPNLTALNCSSNQFKNFNFLTTLPNPQKLTYLSLYDNPINQTLNSLTPFICLKELWLDITNFHSSLSPLSNCQQLIILDISNTNLNSDIELLPANLETIYAENMPEIEEKLKDFRDGYGRYNYQSWRKANPTQKIIQEYSLEKKQSILNLDLSNKNLTFNLDFFSNFTNLESLNLSNNPISGSLQPLQNLTNLKELNISNTNIDSGLEFLPWSLKKLICEADGNFITKRKVNRVKTLLSPYNGDIATWRQSYISNNPFLSAKAKLLELREQQIKELKQEITTKQIQIESNKGNIEQLKQEKAQLEEQAQVLETKYQELLIQIENRQSLLKLLKENKKELEKLKQKHCKHKYIVEDLLEAQDNLGYVSSENNRDKSIKMKNISRLKEQGIKKENITQLCNLQSQITNLEIQLKETQNKSCLTINDINQIKQLTLDNNKIILLFGDITQSIISQNVAIEGNYTPQIEYQYH